MKLEIGDKVMFTTAVVKHCGHSYETAQMRGTVLFVEPGRWAKVDTHGTWPSEDGRNIRSIPISNLMHT